MPTTSSIVSKVASIDAIVDEIQGFLRAPTSSAWVDHALGDLSTLLIDHANCEYKAAATGMSLITTCTHARSAASTPGYWPSASAGSRGVSEESADGGEVEAI